LQVLHADTSASTVAGVAQGFQPAGRAPAPPPLDLVQDFVNTEIPEWAQDDIASPDQLEAWLRARSLLEGDETVDAAAFVAARALRSALRALALQNNVGGELEPSLREHVLRAVSGLQLDVVVADDGRLATAPGGAGATRALASILAVVMDSQANGSWARLKACRKESCGWLFYDASRNRSSNWCSMSICGNRMKTASYRRRRGAGS
jgi:predicted RNA-binding Zn ribbon-like protein